MSRSYKNIISVTLCLLCIHAFGQRTSSIRAVARAQPRQILLRWGANNAQAWKLCNQHGFEVSRFTVIRNKAMLATPERKDLGVFRPAGTEVWKEAADRNEYAAIIAQALFGESFEVSGNDSNGTLSTVNKAQEAAQRFALSLYAADGNFEAALLAGWGLVDTDVKENEKYLYRIKSAVPVGILAIDSAAVFIGLEDHRALPAVTDIHALFTDKTATISWDYAGLSDYYNSYFIERSSDGTNFYRVTEKPVSRISAEENGKTTTRVHYIDTLGMNDVTYHYRVLGVTAFGEVGPPSIAASGTGKKILEYVPHITRAVINETGKLDVEWEFESAGNPLIRAFTLNQSATVQGPYTAVVKNISPEKRSIRYDKLFDTNYFTLTAEAIGGEPRISMPVLVQPLDSIPPAAPAGLNVRIDSAGIVKVSWNANTERDVLGYKVFRAYVKNAELTPLTDSVFSGTLFIDTVSMRMTNRNIYYAVTALDRRFNQSAYSPLVIALKPDVIPPTSPVFTRYELVDYKVALAWADAQDRDVASHALYRKADNETQWKLIQKFTAATPGRYTDEKVVRGQRYAYALVSKDSSNLESKPAGPVSIKVTGNPDDITVNRFNAYVDKDKRYIELFWADDLSNVEEYHLYRKKKGDGATLWKIVQAHEKRIADDRPVANTEYTYGIRVVTKTGEMSRMKWVVVKF